MGCIDMNSADMVVPSPLSAYMRFICTLEVKKIFFFFFFF